MHPVQQTLFSGSPFLRWTLTPVLLGGMICFPLGINPTFPAYAVTALLDLLCAAFLLGMWLPPAYARFAYRTAAACVFVAYLAYLIYEVFFSGKPLRLAGGRGEASPRNAIIGFLVFGWPSLCYILFGRFSWRAAEQFEEGYVEEEDWLDPEEEESDQSLPPGAG